MSSAEHDTDRRAFLARASAWVMAGGLAASYGTCGAFGARYLYPARPRARRWLYVARPAALGVGESIPWVAPGGERIAIARHGAGEEADDFVALSSTCPHLGCQVHWEANNERFFCPCHNGVFDPAGVAISGPPAEAGQSLPRYPLEVRDGLLFIEVPVESLTTARALRSGAPPTAPGHGA